MKNKLNKNNCVFGATRFLPNSDKCKDLADGISYRLLSSQKITAKSLKTSVKMFYMQTCLKTDFQFETIIFSGL